MAAYTTIDDPSAYFKVQLYTGTGSSHAVAFNDTDTDMQPDLVWVATRNEAEIHPIMNSVSGTGKYLRTNDVDTEETDANSITAFSSDGFTMGSQDRVNQSSNTFVAWCWKGGTTSGKSTSGETITPSGYSINATSGVGIFAWSGTGSAGTITHGLGGDVSKGMILVKRINSTAGWQVYHQKTGATHVIYLNSTAVADDSNTVWNDTAPTSSVFTLGTNAGTNASGGTYVGFVFAPKQGFSKMGSYTGNGNADGPFVYTGFRPKLIITKMTSGTANWVMKTDGVGDADNPQTEFLYASATTAEGDGSHIDFLSNGFKWRDAETNNNQSGSTYLYMAFAEAPEVNSNGVPCNAR